MNISLIIGPSLQLFVISMLIGVFTSSSDLRPGVFPFRKKYALLLGFPWLPLLSNNTPNLVTDIVRKRGLRKLGLVGFVDRYAYSICICQPWRRSEVTTDLEFYERYGGKPAAFLRAFRALYLGVFLMWS